MRRVNKILKSSESNILKLRFILMILSRFEK
nr:MAG TPA: hypothetical protein [Bacteriophage sp.]